MNPWVWFPSLQLNDHFWGLWKINNMNRLTYCMSFPSRIQSVTLSWRLDSWLFKAKIITKNPSDNNVKITEKSASYLWIPVRFFPKLFWPLLKKDKQCKTNKLLSSATTSKATHQFVLINFHVGRKILRHPFLRSTFPDLLMASKSFARRLTDTAENTKSSRPGGRKVFQWSGEWIDRYPAWPAWKIDSKKWSIEFRAESF